MLTHWRKTVAKVLIVDDSWLIRKVVGGVLRQAGHEVREGENGRQCLDLVEAERPDLIFLDLLMPEMGGLDVLADLRARDCRLPVVVLTADIQESTHQQCRELGVGLILQKPPRGPDILRAVEQTLAQPV